VTLNLGKTGGSFSFGGRGARFTIGPHGRRTTVGIPGTGLFYTKTYGGSSRSGRRDEAPSVPRISAGDKLNLGFFRRLVTPQEEEDLVDGLRELVIGNEESAYEKLRKAAHLADGAFTAGYIALDLDRLQEAEEFFSSARDNYRTLGRYFSKYGIEATLSLAITGEVMAHLGPSLRGVLLALTEVYQREGRLEDAIACLKRLGRLSPDDAVVKLSLAEVLLERGGKRSCQDVVRLTKDMENSSPLHTALLLYKARALHGLGLLEAARDVLTPLLRRKKDRSDDLMLAIRYERALVYEDLGQKSRARKDLEKIYAISPDYESVAERLGL
jgi:tetratricopeptide (TPR) repeat protein